MKALQAVFELLQSHYPERLHALWFLNAPFIFWGVWRLVGFLALICLVGLRPSHSLIVGTQTVLRMASICPLRTSGAKTSRKYKHAGNPPHLFL